MSDSDKDSKGNETTTSQSGNSSGNDGWGITTGQRDDKPSYEIPEKTRK